MGTKKKRGRFVMNFFKLLAVFFVLVLVGCGDSGESYDVAPSVDTGTLVDPATPVVPSSLILTTSLAAGSELAQGGTTTVTATVYNDNGSLVADGTAVVFIASSGIITGVVPTVEGKALATYNAASAGGAVTITASIGDVNNQLTLSVASGTAAWIELVSISPNRLGLKGSGINEVGVISFNVKDASGNPVSDGTQVDFTLESPTGGGEYLSPSSALTVGGGVSVSLVSGVVGGVATVTANTNDYTVSTEARVTMGYGKPDQLHLSIAFEKLNVAGFKTNGISNPITAYIADRYSNPVPTGTPVYFASECGIVSLDSNLTDAIGVTTVDWITANPKDNLCTSIIWTEGEEAYIDTNGNGAYDLNEPHTGIGEPYIDANENGSYDAASETYFDLDKNGAYTPADTVWDADTFVWTSGVVAWSGYTQNGVDEVFSPSTFNVPNGGSQNFAITIADMSGGPLTEGSTAKVSTDCPKSTLTGDTDITIPDSVFPDSVSAYFNVTLRSTDTTPGDQVPCSMTVEITSALNENRTVTIPGTID